MEIKIGVRPSPLALKQAYEAVEILKKTYTADTFVIKIIDTLGDKDKKTPFSGVTDPDFFTREIDEALLEGAIDFGVHSAKDVPQNLAQGIEVYYETESISPFDCLVSKGNIELAALPKGWRIGVSSQRRKDEIAAWRSDLALVDIRGNIEERLALIEDGKIDALIVAHAALIRLGLEDRIAEVFPLNIFRTHPKQGRLTIVRRIKN
ncbi:MAG: hydroxymethylbilane synthase [Candidatus Omnitrophica bacterium]|nr:hydroxymethylbilane synthase [Candidatus Omnitrophota bacterium]